MSVQNYCQIRKTVFINLIFALFFVAAFSKAQYISRYEQWEKGPSKSQDYFPVGVWLQSPGDAWSWKNAGVNFYAGLWKGPTANQLSMLQSANMQVVCNQNETALVWQNQQTNDGKPLIIGYMQEDEPDNCQPVAGGGYGPPTPPEDIQQHYALITDTEPTRPVFLNLSQGIGWDSQTWTGQGGYIDPETDYPAYIAGSDIASFDIYPMDCAHAQTCGDPWRPALGVQRLGQYSPPNHIIWNFIETGDISANGSQATVEQIRAQIWMSIINGSRGIIYFIHGKTSYSDFDSRALLREENSEKLAGITALNNEITQLAPVINSNENTLDVQIEDVSGLTEVDFMVRQYQQKTYIFSAGMRDSSTVKKFSLSSKFCGTVEVLNQSRQIQINDGIFTDTFNGFDVNIYKIDSSLIPGDINKDGIVSFLDFFLLSQAWLTSRGNADFNSNCDLNSPADSVINQNDLKVILTNWLRNS